MRIVKRILLIILVLVLLIPCGLLCLPVIREWLNSQSHALEYIDICIAYLSLLASVGIAVVIYYFEKKSIDKEKNDRIKSAKLLMYNELDKSIRLYVLNPGQPVNGSLAHLKDVFRDHAMELHEGLTAEQYSHLNILVDCIDSYISSVEEDGRREASEYVLLIFRKWLRLFFESQYYESFSKAKNYKELLDKKTFELLNALCDNDEAYQDNLRIIQDEDGRPLFQHDPDNTVCVFENGETIFDGSLSWDNESEKIKETGYIKTYDYEGYYKDGVRCGKGTKYNHNRKVLAEGIWQDGDLIKGKEFDWVIKVVDGQENLFFQYYDDVYFHNEGKAMFSEMLEECKTFDGCFLADREIKGAYECFENLRSFKEFVKTLPEEEDFFTYHIQD